MLQLALRESPVRARGLCWAPQPWMGTKMGTLEPELDKEVNCGAPLSGYLHPGFPCQVLSPCLCMYVVLLQTHSLCLLFTLKCD